MYLKLHNNRIDFIPMNKEPPELDPLPIPLSNSTDISSLFCYSSCAVSVNYYIYDPKRKTIVKFGSSRACGVNHRRNSIHAEQRAIEYCMKHDKRNKYIIFITKFSKEGLHKPKKSCFSCQQLIHKYNFQKRIFTISENKEIISAIDENPSLCLAYLIKYGL